MRMVRFLSVPGVALAVASFGARSASAALRCTVEGAGYIATSTGSGVITRTDGDDVTGARRGKICLRDVFV